MVNVRMFSDSDKEREMRHAALRFEAKRLRNQEKMYLRYKSWAKILVEFERVG
jgi:hypothetical protein